MKKIFLIFCLLFMLIVPQIHVEKSFADEKQVIVNTSYTYLYKTEEFLEHFDFEIKSNEILNCIEDGENYYKVIYIFENEQYTGYIPYEIASDYIKPQETILVYNGKIIIETEVFEITSDNLLEEIILKPYHQVYIYEGFDSNKEYTNIKFEYNGQVYTGKVLTKNLSPNGINKAVIIALGMIVAIVGIVFILLGFKKKKWHKLLKFKKK